MRQTSFWPTQYERNGLEIPSLRKGVEPIAFTPLDFTKAIRLYAAEEIDVSNPESVFRGMVYAILARGTSYRGQSKILDSFVDGGIDSAKKIVETEGLHRIIGRGAIYPNRLAASLASFARDWWPNLSNAFISCLSGDVGRGRKLRDYIRGQLIRDCQGFGPKCSSLLLRMCGYLDAVPMDRHAIRFLWDFAGRKVRRRYDEGVMYGRKQNATRGLRDRDYFNYEARFAEFAKTFGVAPAALQMLTYVHRTGWDAERHPFMKVAA